MLFNLSCFLCFIPIALIGQQNATNPNLEWSKVCGTMQLYTQKQLQNAKSYPVPGQENLRNASSWNVNDGYGGACTHDCNVGPYDNAPIAACKGGKYQIPFAFTVVRKCGDNSLPDGFTNATDLIAKLDDQIDEMNTYFACAGMPIELVKCTTHGQHTESDNSTRIITDATLCSFDLSTGPDTDNAYADGVDIANIANIYITEVVNNSSSCNGFASLPTGPGAADRIVMQASCFNSFAFPPNDPCNDPGRAVVLIHEVGHFLGLYHTHNPHEQGQPNAGNTAYALPSNPPCTSGDFIADTGADPNFPEFGQDNAGGDACVDWINGTTDDAAFNGQTNPAIDYDNVMSYNNFVGCRLEFTDCQKAKMIDALLCGRTNLICENPSLSDNNNSANYMSQSSIEICMGEAVPSFNVDMPNGAIPYLDTDCVVWYSEESGGEQLGTGLSFTPPTTGAGAINTSVPGTYTYWWDDDANQYTTTANNDYVRKSVTVRVLNDPGAASPASLDASGGGTFSTTANAENIGSGDILGWYLSDNDPTTAWATGTDVMNAITGASTVTGTFTGLNQMMHANSGTPASDLSNFSIDCNMIGGDGSYYLTPFVAYGDADINCSTSANSAIYDFGQNVAVATGAGPVPCSSSGLTNFSYEIKLTLTALSGQNSGGVVMDLNPIGSCLGISTPNPVLDCASPPCTYTFPQSEIDAELGGGFDPRTDEFCVVIADKFFGGNYTTDIQATVEVNLTYTGDNAATKWTANGSPVYQVQTSNPVTCFWGTSQQVSCSSVAMAAEWMSFTGQASDQAIQLNWTTATETDSDYFVLEKSTDGLYFEKLGTVKAVGNSQQTNHYDYLDRQPHNGINYYRLSQTDISGRMETFHQIVAVDFVKNNNITVQPNPIEEETLIIQALMKREQTAELEFFSTDGQLLKRASLLFAEGQGSYAIEVPNLPMGVYLLKVKLNEEIKVIRFVK